MLLLSSVHKMKNFPAVYNFLQEIKYLEINS